MIKLLGVADIKTGSFLDMIGKGTQPPIAASRLGQLRVLADERHQIIGVSDLIDKIRRKTQLATTIKERAPSSVFSKELSVVDHQ